MAECSPSSAECPPSSVEWQRDCSVCYKRGLQQDFLTCGRCAAMVYCSQHCLQQDWGPEETADNTKKRANSTDCCHGNWCQRMAGYMAREPELSDLPFTFIKETTDRAFHEQRAVDFLKRHGVFGKGLWRRELPLLHKTQSVKKCGYYASTAEDKWVLPLESSILGSPPQPPAPPPWRPLQDWQQYYAFRGLPLHSPVAVVLTHALTLYHVLTACLHRDEPALLQKLERGDNFVVHLLGVEKEVEMKEAFLECARLLPSARLEVVMVGRQVCRAVDGFCWQHDNLRLSVCRSLYHLADLSTPDVAVAFNAGLPAYPSWPATLSKLKTERTPAYFTDQSEYSCQCAGGPIGSVGLRGASPVQLNPFRGPMRIVTREQNMPWYPNAFLFSLMY